MYKTDHEFEKYFNLFDGKRLRSFVNFKMCNNVLRIERGRWLRQDVNNRKCTLCNTKEVGDECHYIFKYPLFTKDRNSVLPTRLCRNPNMYTVQNLMNTVNKRKLVQPCSLYQSSYDMQRIQLNNVVFSLFFFILFYLFFNKNKSI